MPLAEMTPPRCCGLECGGFGQLVVEGHRTRRMFVHLVPMVMMMVVVVVAVVVLLSVLGQHRCHQAVTIRRPHPMIRDSKFK
jgi:hypothetical protein